MLALATSAAPTFFPPARFANSLYADGGLVANSPDLVAVHEATHFLQIPRDRVWMVSIGTTTSKVSVSYVPVNTYGVRFWIADREHRLPRFLISAQQQFAQQITEHILQDRYRRIDERCPPMKQAPHLGLDVVTATATATLCALGRKRLALKCSRKRYMQDILSHKAENLLLSKEHS